MEKIFTVSKQERFSSQMLYSFPDWVRESLKCFSLFEASIAERVSDNGTNTITARAIMGSSVKMIIEIITSWITPFIITPKISCIEPPMMETSLVILDMNSPLGVLSTTLIGILAIFSLIFTLILQVKKLLTE